MKNYHTVIVGAGPAGLNCALTLAKAKKKVIVLEQNKVIGPKACAGGLTEHAIQYLKLPARLIDRKYKSAIVHTPLDTDIIQLDRYFMYTIDRAKLGQWQLQRLKGLSAEIRTEAQVTEIGKDYVIINHSEKIGFTNLVGADGSTSCVRKALGLPQTERGVAIHYMIPTRKYRQFEIFFDSRLFHAWYAWIFPHKDYVSIGCGCDPRYLTPVDLTTNFQSWLRQKQIDVGRAKYQACPLNLDYQGYRFGNRFLVGDAAGFASGLSGEGIYQALITGEEIAKIILNDKYVPEKLYHLLRIKQLHENILHLLERSGPFRKAEYEIIVLLLKSRLIDQAMMQIVD